MFFCLFFFFFGGGGGGGETLVNKYTEKLSQTLIFNYLLSIFASNYCYIYGHLVVLNSANGVYHLSRLALPSM